MALLFRNVFYHYMKFQDNSFYSFGVLPQITRKGNNLYSQIEYTAIILNVVYHYKFQNHNKNYPVLVPGKNRPDVSLCVT